MLHFVTGNDGKFRTFNKIFSEYGVTLTQVKINVLEPRYDDVVKIAEEKAIYSYNVLKKPCLATDSGFFIPSLNGFPGTFVNFTLGTIGLEGIIKLLEGKDRRCEFRGCLVFYDGDIIRFEWKTSGTISTNVGPKARGHHWSELSRIFIPDGYTHVLSKMSEKEYRKWERRRYFENGIEKFIKAVSERM